MRLRPIDLPALRARLRPEQALRLTGWRPVWEHRGLLRGPCPIHVSHSSASRALVVSDRVVYCHVCHWRGDAVGVWARLQSLPVLEAAYDLCARLGVDPPYLS